MRRLKQLIALAVLVAIGWGVLWAWQGPFFALSQIDKGLTLRDPGRVERYADLEKIVENAAVVLTEMAKEEAGIAGGDPASTLFGAVAGLVAGQVGRAVSPQAAVEMRRAIQEGTMQRGIGPFQIHQGIAAFGDFQLFDTHATVTLRGTCKSYDAELKVVMEERDAGYPLGVLKKHVLVGIDKDSAKLLARACNAK